MKNSQSGKAAKRKDKCLRLYLIQHINGRYALLDKDKLLAEGFRPIIQIMIPRKTPAVPRFIISSMQLFRAFVYLIDKNGIEKMCYFTGVIDKMTNTYVPTAILTPEMAEQSAVFVKGDNRSICNVLGYLDRYEHTILLQCHSHPGRGVIATYPSSLDLRNHKDIEVCYPAIGAIFVRDGFVRFFSAKRQFEVEIYGKGMREVSRNVFHLDIKG